ncbi:hypothetical protein KCP69_06320 [Salmonella enterica subsp. enterica]|nr:hypothetical protein KCP69_06320 [Salmonella enterica subsp. enterica]
MGITPWIATRIDWPVPNCCQCRKALKAGGTSRPCWDQGGSSRITAADSNPFTGIIVGFAVNTIIYLAGVLLTRVAPDSLSRQVPRRCASKVKSLS